MIILARGGKIARWIALICLALLIFVLVGGRVGLFSGKRPDALGVSGGKLAPCPTTPNCVSSQADVADGTHYVSPIRYSGEPTRAWNTLIATVRAQEGGAVVREQSGYLYAEFTSRWLGFVDDVEFVLSQEGVIHFRSASRLGRKDFGVNRERIERIRSAFAALGRR